MKKAKLRPFRGCQNDRGMSIITALVGASIGMIVMTGVTSMITTVFKSQRTVQVKDANRDISIEIRDLLLDTNNCNASFIGGKPHGAGFSDKDIIKDGSGAVRYKIGETYDHLVTIADFVVKDFVADNPAVNPKKGKADLYISVNKVGDTIGSKKLLSKVKLGATLGANNEIIQCNALGSADSLWLVSPFEPLNIFYSVGNIGIGTNKPKAKLDVEGVINIGGGNNPTASMTGNSLEIATDTTFGGVHNDHTGIRMFAYDMNGWQTAKLGIQVSRDWRKYVGNDNPTKADLAMVVGQNETLVRGKMGVGTTTALARMHAADASGRQIAAGTANAAWADMASNASGAALFGSNVYFNYSDNSFRSSHTHATGLGSRGLAINWPSWGDQSFFSLNGNTVAGQAIAPTNLLTVKNTGRVGIGTNSPRGALDVNGAIRLKAGEPNSADASTNGIAFENNGDTGMFMTNWTNATNGDLAFYMNNSPFLVLSTSNQTVASVNGAIGVRGKIKNSAPAGLSNETLPAQGAYISWNEIGGYGETDFSNHRGGGEGGFAFNFYRSNGTYDYSPLIIRGSGKVGIGTMEPKAKLDVVGGIKVGETADACTAATEGTQRYNNATHAMEYCGGDPLQWLPMGGGIQGVVTTYTGTGNKGVHKYCALMVVQNGWNTNIGNHTIGVYKQSDGSWNVSGACDPNNCGTVCLD